jgi:hypothetical protein
MRMILNRLQGAGFTLNPEFNLASREIKYFGHFLSAESIKVLPERAKAIENYPRPQNLQAVRKFLDMVGFYARFISIYSRVAEPLHGLKWEGAKFVWHDEQQGAFESHKETLFQAPVLHIPVFSKEFVQCTDASSLAISTVLHQRVNGEIVPTAYYSRLLTSPEGRYSVCEKECFASLLGFERCRTYLEHKKFVLECENLSLCWLLNCSKDLGRLGH